MTQKYTHKQIYIDKNTITFFGKFIGFINLESQSYSFWIYEMKKKICIIYIYMYVYI